MRILWAGGAGLWGRELIRKESALQGSGYFDDSDVGKTILNMLYQIQRYNVVHRISIPTDSVTGL